MSTQTLKAGERLWNGWIVSPELANAYNSLSARIAAHEAAGRTPPEHLLNGRHNLLNFAPPSRNRKGA